MLEIQLGCFWLQVRENPINNDLSHQDLYFSYVTSSSGVEGAGVGSAPQQQHREPPLFSSFYAVPSESQ